jgi:hypothetical protein
MALVGEAIVRGLEDLKVYLLTADTPGSAVDVFGSRSLSWDISSDSDELEGDNTIIAVVRNPKKMTGSIEMGATSLAAFAVMLGGTVSTAGTTPNQIKTLNESASAGSTYFQAIGSTFSQDASGRGYQAILKKLLVTSGPSETMATGAWSTPSLDFEGVAISGVLMSRNFQETYAAAA